jgi:hypothetical protein
LRDARGLASVHSIAVSSEVREWQTRSDPCPRALWRDCTSSWFQTLTPAVQRSLCREGHRLGEGQRRQRAYRRRAGRGLDRQPVRILTRRWAAGEVCTDMETVGSNDDVRKELHALVDAYWEELADRTWSPAAYRWSELVFCLVNVVIGDNAYVARQIVGALDAVDLLAPENLTRTADAESQERLVFTRVLRQLGIADLVIDEAAEVLSRVAQVTTSRLGGSIQQFLRLRAGSIRDELVDAFEGRGITSDALQGGISHWLQNVVDLPISSGHEGVVEFCRRHQVDRESLEAAIDELALDSAVVDDLIRLDAWARRSG